MANEKPLTLRYSISHSPNPVRASKSEENKVDIEVMINNPTTKNLQFDLITIEIPVGKVAPSYLSGNPKLPPPDYDHKGDWIIESNDSVIEITPKNSGVRFTSHTVIKFTIKDISVNCEEGVVPVTIMETEENKDSSRQIVKMSNNFPVTDFWPQKKIQYDEDTNKLYWTCDGNGKDYLYRPYSENWPNEQSYTYDRGKEGIETPRLTQPTTFHLDVIKAGVGKIGTLSTYVYVALPHISEMSHLKQYFGRILYLHYIVTNASRCTISIDGKVVKEDAPLDTYHDGYPIYLDKQNYPKETNHNVVLTAYAKEGTAYREFPFILNHLTDTATILQGYEYKAFNVTKDGRYGCCVSKNGEPAGLNVLDLHNQSKPYIGVVDVEGAILDIEMLPNEDTAVVLTQKGITFVDVPKLKIIETIPFETKLGCIRILPNGKFALAKCYVGDKNYPMRVIDLLGKKELYSKPASMDGTYEELLYMTPDSKFVFEIMRNYIDILDIEKRQVKAIKLDVKYQMSYSAVSPDAKSIITGGTYLIFDKNHANIEGIKEQDALEMRDQLWAINIESRTVKLIADDVKIADVVMVQDGKYALASVVNKDCVLVINTSTMEVEKRIENVEHRPYRFAVAPDGKFAFVSTDDKLGVIDLFTFELLCKIDDVLNMSLRTYPRSILVTGDRKHIAMYGRFGDDLNERIVMIE